MVHIDIMLNSNLKLTILFSTMHVNSSSSKKRLSHSVGIQTLLINKLHQPLIKYLYGIAQDYCSKSSYVFVQTLQH